MKSLLCSARLAAAVLMLAASAAHAQSLLVIAQDRDGKPLPDAVVYVMVPNHGAKPPEKPLAMTQRDLTFDPFVLPVMTGTQVIFPNRDRVSHHLRTLAAATNFEFPVYEPGTTPKPVSFDVAGPSSLHCFFHLSMRGYVYAVDTPYFARTDEHGTARIDRLPAGDFEMRIWHPDWVRPPHAQRVTLGAAPANLTVKLDVRPRAKPQPKRAPIERFQDYKS